MSDILDKVSKLQLLRLTWCSAANVVRAKCIPVPSCKDWTSIDKNGIGLVTVVEGLPVMYDAPSPNCGLGPVGEVRLKPDWKTLTELPYAKRQARVLINMYEQDGERSQHCPRYFLQRMIDQAAENGLIVKAGFENEFILLQSTEDGGIKEVDDTVYAASLSIDVSHDFITDMIDALLQQGIELEIYHPEAAHSQHEIAVRYSDVMTAADQQIIVRETIKAVAIKHKKIATFLPSVFPDQAGNGCHIHLSLHTMDGVNIVPSATKPNELSDVASHFIAGMLEHMNAIMAISCPSTNSYRRIAPGRWSGAFRVWGYENREVSVRVPTNPCQPNPTNFELKTSDTTGNPYYVLGIVIAAGLDGIKRKLPIPEPVQDDPGSLTEDERKARGIDRLPSDLRQSLDALIKDQVLLDALQPRLAKAIIGIREFEYKVMKDMSFEEERKLLLQRF